METNIFIHKFQNKNKEELINIINDKETYIDEARYAAILILEEKGNDITSFEDFKQSFEENQAQEQRFKQQLEREKRNQEQAENIPILYSKAAIIFFSVFFSSIFGAALLISNMKVMQKKQGKNNVLIFIIVYSLVEMILLNLISFGVFTPVIFNILGALILNEYFWNKYLGRSLVFEKKSYTKAFFVTLAITFVLFAIMLYFFPKAI